MITTLTDPLAVGTTTVSALVQAGFNAFVAPDWEPAAQQLFLSESSPERLAEVIPGAAFASVAVSESEPVGFILMTKPTLLAMLFVHPKHLRRGVGTLLWNAARAHVEANFPDAKTVELNSSPYAVQAYRRLGFYPISEPFRRGGCLATRMACWLPERALRRDAP